LGCKRLKLELLQSILTLRSYGVSQFMVACDPGVGLWAAEMVGRYDDELQLSCVLPHEEQATKWAPYLRERYFDMLEQCTRLTTVSAQKTPESQWNAYRVIIDQSEIALSVYDPASARGDAVDRAMTYALDTRRSMVVIHPDTLRVTVRINGARGGS
jgi:uncharacterized phage-like protein YoqJ